jgi:hypothetical protein
MLRRWWRRHRHFFGSIFYYLGGVKTIKVMPGEAGEMTLEDDYWGQPELVKVARQWVSLLEEPARLREMGGQPVTGVLLSGPPGSGKTHLARCMTGTAAVPFLGLDGSRLISMWLGVGSIKIMRLFAAARRRCIERARQTLREHADRVEALVAELLERRNSTRRRSRPSWASGPNEARERAFRETPFRRKEVQANVNIYAPVLQAGGAGHANGDCQIVAEEESDGSDEEKHLDPRTGGHSVRRGAGPPPLAHLVCRDERDREADG